MWLVSMHLFKHDPLIRTLTLHSCSPELHFVKVDVKSAFDSIRLDKLFEVMDEILNSVSHGRGTRTVKRTQTAQTDQEDQFVVRKFVRMLPSTGRKPKKYGSMAHSRRASNSEFEFFPVKLITARYLGDMQPFHSRLLHSTQRFRNAVLLDQVQMTSHFGEQLRQTLHSHLREHLVKVGILSLSFANPAV